MAIENINVGALPNDGSGDAVRTAFGKVNNNFDEVDTRLTTSQGDADAAQVDATQALADAAAAQATADAAIPATEKGAASGVATLGTTRTLAAGERPSAGLYLPGTAGNYASTPDKAALDVTDNLDLRLRMALPDWSPAATQIIMSKWNNVAAEKSWTVRHLANGLVNFQWYDAGGTVRNLTAGQHSIVDGSTAWVRLTFEGDVGGQVRVRWYARPDSEVEPADWGTPDFTATGAIGPSTIRSGPSPLEVGSSDLGAFGFFPGTIYRAQVYDGIDGTLVADFNAESPPSRHGIHPSAFTDSVGNAWTINGSAWEYRDDLGRTLATAAEAAASTPGVAGGLATLDALALVPDAQAPSLQRVTRKMGKWVAWDSFERVAGALGNAESGQAWSVFGTPNPLVIVDPGPGLRYVAASGLPGTSSLRLALLDLDDIAVPATVDIVGVLGSYSSSMNTVHAVDENNYIRAGVQGASASIIAVVAGVATTLYSQTRPSAAVTQSTGADSAWYGVQPASDFAVSTTVARNAGVITVASTMWVTGRMYQATAKITDAPTLTAFTAPLNRFGFMTNMGATRFDSVRIGQR